jgi:cell division protein FtsB
MASVKKQLKQLTKRQDALEHAMRDLKPKRLRKLIRRLGDQRNRKPSRKPRIPSLPGRRAS